MFDAAQIQKPCQRELSMCGELQQIVEALLMKESAKEGSDVCRVGPYVVEDFRTSSVFSRD